MSGGRWNSRGRRVVYLSTHLSLATLEVLVHSSLSSLPRDYIAIPIEIPDDLSRQTVNVAGLPGGWQDPGESYCLSLGDAWYDAARTLALDVPSAVIPLERNIILNPSHSDFATLDTSHVGYPLQFDSRLLALLKVP
jgi:RES domain-containing protein